MSLAVPTRYDKNQKYKELRITTCHKLVHSAKYAFVTGKHEVTVTFTDNDCKKFIHHDWERLVSRVLEYCNEK